MTLKERIHNLPIIKQFVNFLKSIPLAKNAFSLYDLLELYTAGIIRGALTYRASAISYIFFDIADKKRGGLLSSVFFLSIFLMTNGIMAIFGGFEYSYHRQITRTYIKQYLYALMVAIILALLVLFAVVVFIYYEV